MTTRTRDRLVGILLVLALLALGFGIGYAVHSPPTPPPKAEAPLQCQPDPAAAIAALPSGATWTGTGCYDTTGILITKPVTIDGGTFYDSVAAKPIKPIFQVKLTDDVTIENVSVNGANTTGGYHPNLVNGAGFDVQTVAGLTMIDDASSNTFGDGLTLAWASGKGGDSNVVVNGLTVTKAGRQGITPAFIDGGTFSNIDIQSAADSGIDFESDIGKVGDTGTMTWTNVVTGGVNMIEHVGTVNFTNLADRRGAVVHVGEGGAVTFTGGSFDCPRFIAAQACVRVNSGTLTLSPTTVFTWQAGKRPPNKPFTIAIPPGVLVGGP